MKISKASWHYRFTETYGVSGFKRRCADGRHTTCSYIRAVIYAALRAGVAWTSFAAFAGILLFVVVSMVSMPVVVAAGAVIIPKTILDFMLAACVLGWIATAIGLALRLVFYITERLNERSERRQSLIAQAYKDKKDGVCTLVEVVE